jgi:succinate dehydrogenase/fumarate reductase flavoprotein subunit
MLKFLNGLFDKRSSALSVVDPALRKVLKRKGTRDRGQGARNEGKVTEFIEALKLPDGKEFRWDGHEDLKAIAEDNAQVVIVEKAAQKGVTELMLRLQFWLCFSSWAMRMFC